MQPTITVSCAAPKAGESIIVRETMYQYYDCYWTCTLTNQLPQLRLSLMSVTNPSVDSIFIRPKNIRSLRIVSRYGTLVHNISVNGIPDKVLQKIEFDMTSVTIGQRLDFDIVLSERPPLYRISPTKLDKLPASRQEKKEAPSSRKKKDESAVPKLKEIMSPLMRDIATMNMAFTFGLYGSARNVALWGHQSILTQLPSLSVLISKLKDVKGDSSSTEAVSGVKATHVTEYSLEAYCALVRYLYTSEIKLEVDLDDFAIGCPPNKPFLPSCKSRPVVEGLFPSKDTASLNAEPDLSDELSAFGLVELFKLHESDESDGSIASERATTWSDLFQIADCYQVTELREYCLDKIVETLDASTVLDVLFSFAYRYSDLKATVLKYAANRVTELYSKGKDPFSAYADHPQRHELMSEALYVVFNAKSQI